MTYRATHVVPATPASAMVFGESYVPVGAFGGPDAGETIIELPRLHAHEAEGYKLHKPNCVLRWAKVPAGYAGPVDVAVHFHGYISTPGGMTLADEAGISGLNLDAVTRPTIGLIPHGRAAQWWSYKKDDQGHYILDEKKQKQRVARLGDSFTFPAIDSESELNDFIGEALAAWAARPGAGKLSRARVVLTGHSGGGAALSQLMSSIGKGAGVQGFHYFDGTYGGLDTLTDPKGWAASAIERDAQAIAGLADDEARHRYMRTQGSHLRLCFIPGTDTASIAKQTDEFLRQRLAALVKDAGQRSLLRRYYRAQSVVDAAARKGNPAVAGCKPGAKGSLHNYVPCLYGPRLVTDPADDLSPEAADLTAPAAKSHALDDEWDDLTPGAQGWHSEAQDAVTMPQLPAPARPADAPGGAAFIATLGERRGVERENRIYEQLAAGNLPPSLRLFSTVRTQASDRAGTTHDLEFYVTPDYLAIGSDADAVRIPMDPVTAQRVADRFGCLLPTARMVEQIYQAAPVKLAFIYGGYAGTPRAALQDASSSYLEHSRKIDAQLHRPPTLLTAGHKKDLVITANYVRQRRHRETGVVSQAPMLAFYGAYTSAGEPIQAVRAGDPPRVLRGMPSFAHEPSFVDYSHGVRLVWPTLKIDGQEHKLADVLRSAELSPLLAAEGPIAKPRFTLDRQGKPAAAQTLALYSDDPLALDPPRGAGALGYGTSWDEKIRVAVEGFLAEFMAIRVTVGGQALRVHPPYFINIHDKTTSQTSIKRHKAAEAARASAPPALRALINEKRFANARVGKSTTADIRDLLQDADARGLLLADPTVKGTATADKLRDFLVKYGIGVDCSGFVAQALNRLLELAPPVKKTDQLDIAGTPSGQLKGGQGLFTEVSLPTDLCAGDTMWLKGHIRILSWAERRGPNIVFCTAESRSSRPKDIGPAVAYWRLEPSTDKGSGKEFKGWLLRRSSTLDAPERDWAESDDHHVFGHYRPLRDLLSAQGVTPVALQAAGNAPTTADTSDLVQPEVDQLAAIGFGSAADIDALFQNAGHKSFIDWYNAGLAHSKPFADRGAISTKADVRRNFTDFFDRIPVAFDRPQITALDFAAFMAISINETGGNLSGFAERGGKGRSDSKGAHPGLAYFFDAVENVKSSYNTMHNNQRAGDLFNDADYIAAHGGLGGATALAHHGGDFGGAWNGAVYPQASFSTSETDPATEFIRQADFHKFRGRGVMQTTGRESYLALVRYIQSYAGRNKDLLAFAKAWKGLTADAAATRSSDSDWTVIFDVPEIRAKALSTHAKASGDYRQMSTSAPVLLDVAQPSAKDRNPRGQLGSIYAMGRRISGRGAYGRGIYRERVLALMHGILGL